MVEKKIGAENPKTLPAQPGSAQYIKYTPSQQSAQHASGATTRIIKMQDMPVDPLEPPKFRWVTQKGSVQGLGWEGVSRWASLPGQLVALGACVGGGGLGLFSTALWVGPS